MYITLAVPKAPILLLLLAIDSAILSVLTPLEPRVEAMCFYDLNNSLRDTSY